MDTVLFIFLVILPYSLAIGAVGGLILAGIFIALEEGYYFQLILVMVVWCGLGALYMSYNPTVATEVVKTIP